MKTRTFIYILIFAALTFSACAPIIKPTSDAHTEAVTNECFRSSDEVRLLINSVYQYCLQYPAEYDVFHPKETEIMLFKRSVLNVSEPSVSIKVQPAVGMTADQAADSFLAVYSLPAFELVRESLTIDSEEAIMLDKLSGQEINRRVFVVYNDILYQLSFMPVDESRPELYAQTETLYKTVIQSFNFRPDSNACPGCPAPEEDLPGASISGWIWHDQCDSGKDGQPAPVTTPPGCVNDDSPLGPYHADGVLAIVEPLIEGVVVTLGEGECPATGLAEMSTITTDLSYSFTGLKAGTYCVSIDPQREPNFSILRPGIWTYPTVGQDVISTTVTLVPGEYKGMLNFGWDYQFQP